MVPDACPHIPLHPTIVSNPLSDTRSRAAPPSMLCQLSAGLLLRLSAGGLNAATTASCVST